MNKISHEWLRLLGFRRGMQAASSNVLILYRDTAGAGPFISAEERNGFWSIAISDGDVAVYLPAGLTPQDKVGFRLLCDAFEFPCSWDRVAKQRDGL